MKKVAKFSLAYIYVKLVKQSGAPDYIARGVAIGFMVGMVVPILFQTMVAIPLAFLFKGAKIPAFACTWVTNHATIFIIYPIQCWVGGYLIGNPLTFAKVEKLLETVIEEPHWEAFKALGGQIIGAFFAGGFLFGLLLAIPGYFISLYLVKKHREHKKAKLHRRRKKFKAAKAAKAT